MRFFWHCDCILLFESYLFSFLFINLTYLPFLLLETINSPKKFLPSKPMNRRADPLEMFHHKCSKSIVGQTLFINKETRVLQFVSCYVFSILIKYINVECREFIYWYLLNAKKWKFMKNSLDKQISLNINESI